MKFVAKLNVLLGLACIGSLAAQVRHQSDQNVPGRALMLARADFNTSTHVVTLVLHNSGTRSINAFRVQATIQYADGKRETFTRITDLLPLLAVQEAWNSSPVIRENSSLGPGDDYLLRYSVHADYASAELATIALIFGDCTAVGDEGAINEMFASRVDEAASRKNVLASIKAARSNARSHGELVKSVCDKAFAASHIPSSPHYLDYFCRAFNDQGEQAVEKVIEAFEIQANAYNAQKERRY